MRQFIGLCSSLIPITMEPKVSINITDGASSLTIKILYRHYPNETDYWDGNWVEVNIEANTPGFHAKFGNALHLSELDRLREDLTRLYSDLNGEAVLNAMDGFLVLKATVDSQGHLNWTVKLIYPVWEGARLRFKMESDQSYLPNILKQLESAFNCFPIKGEPE